MRANTATWSCLTRDEGSAGPVEAGSVGAVTLSSGATWNAARARCRRGRPELTGDAFAEGVPFTHHLIVHVVAGIIDRVRLGWRDVPGSPDRHLDSTNHPWIPGRWLEMLSQELLERLHRGLDVPATPEPGHRTCAHVHGSQQGDPEVLGSCPLVRGIQKDPREAKVCWVGGRRLGLGWRLRDLLGIRHYSNRVPGLGGRRGAVLKPMHRHRASDRLGRNVA